MGKKMLKVHQVDFKDDKIEFNWYIVSTRMNYERFAADNIVKKFESMNQQDKFGDIIVPMIKVTEINDSGKEVVKMRNLYDSGYVIINMILTNDTWNLVRQTAGVIGWLESNNRPFPISKEEIDKIKSQLEQHS